MNIKKTVNTFKCQKCEKIIERSESSDIVPECCSIKMEKMEEPAPCQTSATAEHARANEMLEPCDDGREGKIKDQ
jgi:hypothetical protein